MHIAIIGLGGVGGILGGNLATQFPNGSDHHIHFIAKGEHAEMIRRQGITVIYETTHQVSHPFSINEKWTFPYPADVIFVTIKNYDLLSIQPLLSTMCGPETLIIPLQNGLGNVETLMSFKLPGIISDGCVYVIAEKIKSGVIKQFNPVKKIIFGHSDQLTERMQLAEKILKSSGWSVILTQEPLRYKWLKFQFICGLSAVTGRYQLNIAETIANPSYFEEMVTIFREIAQTAKTLGIPFPPDSIEKSIIIAKNSGNSTTSFQRDIAAGHRNELEAYLGELIRLGDRLRLELPVSRKFYRWFKDTIKNNPA